MEPKPQYAPLFASIIVAQKLEPREPRAYLIDTNEECAERTVQLLRDPGEAQGLGASDRAYVNEHFLITRLLTDELKP